MPLERDRYPDDWTALSRSVKAAANWTCQHCGRPCRKAYESLDALSYRLNEHWLSELLEEVHDKETGEWGSVPVNYQKFCLTTAHLNQNPADNRPENLMALCAPCHLNHDRKWLPHNRYRKRERQGQLSLKLLNF
jgi:hypothetical protein